MDFAGMIVQQNGQTYSVYTPNGILVCQVCCGYDQMYLLDAKVMQYICRVLARRWNISNK